MEVIKQMKNALTFMENNLYENISLHDCANHVYMSSFNFHRTFKIFTGITPTEYIRNRRLSNAAFEITHSDLNILDIALKYQYDSLEGFSKAFKRFHGVTPSIAKEGNVSLTIYDPLKINISFEGGKGMEYKIITKEPFTLLQKSAQFEIDAEVNLIPTFWKNQTEQGLLKKLISVASKKGFYGTCKQVDPSSNSFTYGIGVEVDKNTTLEGLEVNTITHPLWAVFECKSVDHIGETWDFILKQFLVNTDYVRVEELDFEFYPEDNEDVFCELYIPVKRND